MCSQSTKKTKLLNQFKNLDSCMLESCIILVYLAAKKDITYADYFSPSTDVKFVG